MLVNSTYQKPTYEVQGGYVRFFLDEELVPAAEDVEQSWNYQVAKVLVDSSRNEKIEAVMATRYPTYGSELAAVNNGGQDYEDYLEFRNEAKRLVDSFEGY